MLEQKLQPPESQRLEDISSDLADLIHSISPINPELTHGTLNLLSVVEEMLRAVLASENALHASEASLTAIIENTQDSIWSVNPDYRLVMVNSAFRAFFVFLYAQDLEPGANILDALPPEVRPLWKERIDRAFTGNGFMVEDQSKLGTMTFHFETSYNPILDKDMVVKGVSVFSREVTKRKQAEVEREQLILELQNVVRFKDEFLATMSHELRTPLNAIIGFTEIALMQEDDLKPQMVHMLQRVTANSKRLLGLINNVLDISRIAAGRLELVTASLPLQSLMDEWRHDFTPRAKEKGIEFKVSLDPQLPAAIYGDKERLTQIVTNLLANAFKFTGEGYVELAAMLQGESLVIRVSDTGTGIPDSYHHLIFDEFRQVDSSSSRQHGGAGLGLSIVKKLCILMDGKVAVQSTPGQGSTFTVTLPLRIGPVTGE
jgi:PAS domain S-box-containing protein